MSYMSMQCEIKALGLREVLWFMGVQCSWEDFQKQDIHAELEDVCEPGR